MDLTYRILLGLLLSTAISAQAWGQTSQTPVRIGVFPFQSSESSLPRAELESFSRKVLSQFEQNDLYNAIRKYPLIGGKPPQQGSSVKKQRDTEMQELQTVLANIVQKMNSGDSEKVIPYLKGGLRKASKAIRWRQAFPIITRICGLWALAAFRMGNDDEGELLLKTVARMNPQPPPAEIQANPQMKFRYQRSVKSIQNGPKGSIRVIGTEGATVYVDGKKQGTIPQEVNDLPKGLHYVRVVHRDHFPWGGAVNVGANGTITVRAYLQAAPQASAHPTKAAQADLATNIQLLDLQSERLQSAARTICDHTKLEILVTGQMKKQGQEYALIPVVIRCNDTTAIKGQSLSLNATLIDAELTVYRAVIDMLKKKPDAAPPTRVAVIDRRPVPAPATPGGTPVYKKWWFWTLILVPIAGGAAAATTVIILNQSPRIGVSAKWSFK